MNFDLDRREFIRYTISVLAAFGLGSHSINDVAAAFERIGTGKAPIVWITGLYCGACAESVANTSNPDISSLLLSTLSLKVHPVYGAMGGPGFFDQLAKLRDDDYILIVEGALPEKKYEKLLSAGVNNDRRVAGTGLIDHLASRAAAVIAVGTCASFGGIFRTDDVKVTGVSEAIGSKNIINIPGCPPHPDWLVLTLLYLVMEGKAPSIDHLNRPKAFYSKTVHDACQRRLAFENGHFVEPLAADDGGCLYKTGCKGPMTFADCPSRLWNDGAGWCVASGGICIGCSQPEFMRELAPLHLTATDVKLPLLGGRRAGADKIGLGIAAAAGSAAAAHLVSRALSRKPKDTDSQTVDDE